MDQNNKIVWLDCLKGLGIVLVYIGHNSNSLLLTKYIYSFHMSLFFIISGYLSCRHMHISIIEYVKKKYFAYISPYIKLYIIHFVFLGIPLAYYKYGISYEFVKKIKLFVLGGIIGYGNSQYMPVCSPLWFLTCIFIASILWFVLNKYNKLYYIIFLVSISYYFSYYEYNIYLPWNIFPAFVGCSFMMLGYLYYYYQNSININSIGIVSVIFIGVLFCFVNQTIRFPYVNIGNNYYGNIIYMYISSISTSFGLLYVFKKYNIYNNILMYIGRNSLLFMGVNYLSIFICDMFIKILQVNIGIFEIILNFLISYFIVKLIKGYIY